MSKLSDVVKNDVLKKAVYEKLAANVNNIDTSAFVLKTKNRTDKTELETKIFDVTDFVKKAKLNELENKILDLSSLATKIALTAVENKIPDVGSLVKKTDYDTKISQLEKKLTDHDHDKYITTPEFNTLAANVFNARLAQADLITKTDFDAKLSSFNRKVTAYKSRHLLDENVLKSEKHSSQAILLAKVILKKMLHKIIYYFNQCTDILKGLLVLVMAVTLITGNLKDCLMKKLILLKHPIIVLLQT